MFGDRSGEFECGSWGLKGWMTRFLLLFSCCSIYLFIYLFIYLSRGIQFSRASLNGVLTKHKNKDIKTLKLDNSVKTTCNAGVTV